MPKVAGSLAGTLAAEQAPNERNDFQDTNQTGAHVEAHDSADLSFLIK